MLFSPATLSDSQELVTLFTDVFSSSEGKSEGESIGHLVAQLISETGHKDVIGYVAVDGSRIVACIFFSRFIVPNGQTAFLLSPVAVATDLQGTGIGQRLINYGLKHLRFLKVDLVFTYGDPNFYTKTGFNSISENHIKAPFTLSQPSGWLVQSLDGHPIESMQGPTLCVEAFNHSEYW